MEESHEKPKRLQPLPETLRRLFLTSGNLCAFPGCKELMIDADGNFIGQVCHIEAAEKGGERFNSSMTNEQRRAFENLVLMCYRHHKITDDVSRYSTTELRFMKATHEAAFSDPAVAMTRVLEDETAKTVMHESRSLARMNEVLGWKLDSIYLLETAKFINDTATRLKNVPKNARSLVRIIIERAGSVRYPTQRIELPIAELEHSVTFDLIEIFKLLQILDRHGLVDIWEGDGPSPMVKLLENKKYPGLWFDLLMFSRESGVPLKSIIDDMEFHLLD